MSGAQRAHALVLLHLLNGAAHLVEKMRGLDAAYTQARERAAQVTSYDGYVATMSALAGAAEDRHVAFVPLYQPDPMRWAGYDGDMSDVAALEAWVSRAARQ